MVCRNIHRIFRIAYSLSSAYSPGVDADYTTWKIREDGEHKQTLDYIFYSAGALDCEAVLAMPSGDALGEERLPSAAFASDHLSLVADLRLRKKAAIMPTD